MTENNRNKWMLILNPLAGGKKGYKDRQKIEELLKAEGIQYEVVLTEYPGHAVLLAKQAIEKGERQLIAAGGDGTLNEVVNGVFQQSICLPESITIGMIPLGTGNDWIKTFGIPNNYKGAIQKIKEGSHILQDVGKLSNVENKNDPARYFVNMAGFGFDALAAFEANAMKEKGRRGKLIYIISLLSAYLQYSHRKVKVSLNGKQIEELTFSISVGIGKYNGGGMKQAPDAIPNNGMFEVTLIKKIGLWGILTNLAGIYSGKYIKDRRVLCYRASELTISSEKPLLAETDGESLGQGQFFVKVLPRAVRVIIGRIE